MNPSDEIYESRPPPTGHPLPRRASPSNSVTLRHHRLARDASLRAAAGPEPAEDSKTNTNHASVPRRNSLIRQYSSGGSHETGNSDPKRWFDDSNENPTAAFDGNAMDTEPPFFQKETDSSNDDKPLPYPSHLAPAKRVAPQSSSGDDYRSVIDDLTVEIQKLKEELRHYRQSGPDMLRKEKLFEIKIHGLPRRKKRELETTLRDFAASLSGSHDASSSQRKTSSSRRENRDQIYSASGSMSKHASSTTGSQNRPVDSAYASMSTGAHSSSTSLGRPIVSSSGSRVRSSEQKVESYLRDIPEGLYPRHMIMTDKDKKKLVVRRLEHLFTGKIAGRQFRRDQLLPSTGSSALAPPAVSETQLQSQHQHTLARQTSSLAQEPSREARILPSEQQPSHLRKKSRSGDNGSASNSNGDQTEAAGNGGGSGGSNPSPPLPSPPEQRPTRPKDLDPDRVQVPSENVEYIRHLGLVPPELLPEQNKGAPGVNPDAEGWVYLNLLCNLAQLHIINVTPDFVRSAVSEISTEFQLSPDGRKIRWCGGTEGTRFTSDSPGDNVQKSPEADETDSSNKEQSHKRQKTDQSVGDEFQSENLSKFGPQISMSSDSFQYKPLFVHRDSSNGETTPEDTLSSFGPVEESMVGDSRWGRSGSGTTNRRKRRHDGAIIYYSGAPFFTDLSGDSGDMSPATYMMSTTQAKVELPPLFSRPLTFRSSSGSSLPYRPLSEKNIAADTAAKMHVDGGDSPPGLVADSGDESDVDCDFLWTDDQQFMEVRPLEPCGLGGVLPDDHFMVVVTTRRPKMDAKAPAQRTGANMEEAAAGIIGRLGTMSTPSPRPPTSEWPTRDASPDVEIDYMSGRIRRLAPVPLPPPAIFVPPFTNSSWSDDNELGSEEEDDDSSEELMSRRANPHQSDDYPDGVDLTSGDEDGEDPDDEPDARRMYELADGDADVSGHKGSVRGSSDSEEAVPAMARGSSRGATGEMRLRIGGSSAATAGGVDSAFSSADESSSH